MGTGRHLVELLPYVSELLVLDNSEEAAQAAGLSPKPKRLLHWRGGEIVEIETKAAPDWARPILSRAIELMADRGQKPNPSSPVS